MLLDAARARGAPIVAFAAALFVYAMTASWTPAWPPIDAPTPAGRWVIDAVSQIPIGDPIGRAAVVAVLFAALTAALIAWALTRYGSITLVAAGVAVAAACTPALWQHAVSDLPRATAALLIASAVAIAIGLRGRAGADAGRTPRSMRVAIVAMLGAAALALQPLAPSADESTRSTGRAIMYLAREVWLLPGAALMVSALAAPLWGAARAPLTAMTGTAVAVLLTLIGRDAAWLAMFPAMLMAHGINTLPSLTSRGRAGIAVTLAIVAALYRSQTPAQPAWQLTAWRDAVERAVPAGSIIRTQRRAIAALDGPLFAGRSSRISLSDAPDADSSAAFVVDDLRPMRAADRLSPVPLHFASASDALTHLPPGTVVGLAVTAPVIADHHDEVSAALAAIGHAGVNATAHGLVAIGFATRGDAIETTRAQDHVHVFMGDLIGDGRRRSPTDIELRVSDSGARVRLRGHDLIAADGWAVVAVDRYGALIGTFESHDTGGVFPLVVSGLQLWRTSGSRGQASGSRPQASGPRRQLGSWFLMPDP